MIALFVVLYFPRHAERALFARDPKLRVATGAGLQKHSKP